MASSPLVFEPDSLVQLSVLLGEDLTPHQDLDQRLRQMRRTCSQAGESLLAVMRLVQGYEEEQLGGVSCVTDRS